MQNGVASSESWPPSLESSFLSDGDIEKKHEATPPTSEQGSLHEPYSAFSRSTKTFLVVCASASAFMSPFAINIYMPAVPNISEALNISDGEALLSVTMYMIFQGLSPSVWAPLSDTFGRRPVLLCTFTVFLVANLGLSFANTYWLLLVLRMLQACGASSAIAIGAGCISDVSEQKERGSYMGYFQCGTLLGPSIGPVIGGFMAQAWDWHAVFFFLSAFGGSYLLFLLLCLPESLRALVGRGDKKPVSIWRTILPLRLVPNERENGALMAMPPKLHIRTLGLEHPWRMYTRPDVALMIASYAIPFGGFTVMSSTLSTILYANYQYKPWEMGMCFITIGVGSAIGSILSGYVLDRDYAHAWQKHGHEMNLHHTRMKHMGRLNLVFCLLFIANGWLLDQRVHIAAPLILQFFASVAAIMYYNCINTLLVDLDLERAASITAALNIGRCLTGAVFVAAVQYIVDAIGYGWTMLLIGVLCELVPVPMLWAVTRHGPAWLQQRKNPSEK
ncbi:hypothetical protein MEQU1_002177 [Malassezia equina]|uniref:Major facilitator superfamily (MFS) profile domain-containing protein n=1 Tax=Malassezia equina TaxID=1381935 RepID=A0AAF0EF93_9BASI|nr:hypothetical protein MEQU1_002177 [Malassezia equina]